MSTPRTDFAAVGLRNGKVLFIGGQTSTTTDTAVVDAFDPATNTVMPVAPMHTPRHGFTATLLADGRVLVAGGASTPTGSALASTEIYDPAANTWSAAAPMAQARAHDVAVLMNNGKEFVIGATGPEVYDPATNTWTTVARFNWAGRPRSPAVTVLSDGRVFIFSGFATANLGDAVANYYDPATAQASYGPCLSPFEVDYSTAAQLADGTVLIVGGQQLNTPGSLDQTIAFDPSPAADRQCNQDKPWSLGPSMNVGHNHHTMTALASGRLIVVGGQSGQSDSISVVELYEPTANHWWLAAPLHEPRAFHAAVLLASGQVLAAGGIGTGSAVLATTEIYTPS